MLSEPRTISLIAELLHVPTVHAAEKLREVYNEVCRSCGYENFIRLQGGARIERRDPDKEGFSQLNILNDRIQITEDHTGVSVEQFGKRIVAVVEAALPALQIPLLLAQQNTVRTVVLPNNYRSASEFLALSVFKINAGDLQPLGRPTNVFGFRLVFPPTQEHPQNYNVRVESYVRDAKALYIENVGTFKSPIQAQNLGVLEENLEATAGFLVENVIPFLSKYDRREVE